VKAIALILALTIFGGTVKGSPLMSMVKASLGIEQCHTEQKSENVCHSDNEESDNCCGDMGCECTCCVHILILTAMIDFDFLQESYADSKYVFVWDYHRDYLSNTFHPPA